MPIFTITRPLLKELDKKSSLNISIHRKYLSVIEKQSLVLELMIQLELLFMLRLDNNYDVLNAKILNSNRRVTANVYVKLYLHIILTKNSK